ncbi:hypothetical protein [Prevotella jejuni]
MKNIFLYHALSALFVSGMTLSAVSCADDDLGENTNNGDKGAVVQFNVGDAQEEALTRGGAMTRGAITQGLTNKDLDGRKLEIQGNENLNLCLIETTVEGVNPVKQEPGTRANIITTQNLSDFSSTGVRGTAANAINTEWFEEQKTKKDGTLYTPISWSWLQPYGRFYAVYPESKNSSNGITFTKPNGTAAPSIVFTVNKDVRQQVDLMTACSGNVQYATRFQAPKTDLKFRHALTAIRFAVGQNLSFDKTIKDITLKNVLLKSKYTLSNNLDGTGAAWDYSGNTERGDVKLSNVNYKTNENANSIVRDISKYSNSNITDPTKLEDNYTFYMIPQDLDNKVTAEVEFTDGSKITVPLKGSWKAGTTRTYKLSQKNSTWIYSINQIGSPVTVAYNGTQASYKIESYRQAPDGTKQAVAWKVVGYSVDNETTWTTTKPSWLKSLSKEQSNGGTAAEPLTATLGTDIVDLLAQRNKGLQEATPLGNSSTYYNLSNATGAAAVQNTANCYVISAPGYYMIPLVYGNAIKNGQTNTSAYKSTAPNTPLTFGSPAKSKDVILHNFVDHNSKEITDPWIEKTNNRAYKNIDGAEVTWSDESNLVELANSPIYHDASGNAFVKFEVKKDNLKSGNAVISVKKGNTILWSWHLWFAPKNALDKITVTNNQGKKYDFTRETLGWKPTEWTGTSYSTPRTVKVKVEQTQANNGVKQYAVVTITQNPGLTKKNGTTTFYQWGRKDALPGTDATLPQGSIIKGDNQIHMNNKIQKPNTFFVTYFDGKGKILQNDGLIVYNYFYNLWSMNNNHRGDKDAANDIEVVKTIYDPCPVGFNVPTNGAFSGFTTNGKCQGPMNVDGTNVKATYDLNSGHLFWTNSNKTETIYFPASGYRSLNDSKIAAANVQGDYWAADPYDWTAACVLGFSSNEVYPLFFNTRTYGFAVRPVAEK